MNSSKDSEDEYFPKVQKGRTIGSGGSRERTW